MTAIVLGCSHGGVTEQFRSRLAENVDLELVEIVEDGRMLLEALDRVQPDVLVLHADLGPLPALEQVRDTAMTRPHLGIVLLAEDLRPETYARAMEAGARGVLGTSSSLEELTDRIDAAAGWSRLVSSHLSGELGVGGGRRGRLVTVSGAKGGVGASLVATLAALAAQRQGLTTALVDLDLQNGDVAHLLGIQTRRTVLDLVDVAGEMTARSLGETSYLHDSGLRVLVAPEHGEHGEDMTARAARLILANLRMQVDLVVVDCGAHVDDATAVAVEQSDTVLLVATPDVPALRSARRRLEMWERLQIAKPEDVGVVLNKAHRRLEIQPDVAQQVLGRELVQPVVPFEQREAEEMVNGAVVGLDRGGRLAKSVVELARSASLFVRPGEVDAIREPVPGPAAPGTRRNGGGRRRRPERGQVMVETPVLVSLLLLFALMLLQMLFWGWTQVVTRGVAHEVARVAAVGGDTCAAARDKVTAGWDVDGCPLVDEGSSTVGVTVTTPTFLPWIGELPVHIETSYVSEQ